MLKAVAVVTVPSALAGAGLFYGGPEVPLGPEPQLGAYAVQVGVAFPELAVRAALPKGLEPAPSFTGGVAIYRGEEGGSVLALSSGYVWIDAIEQTSGSPARYIVKDFVSEVDDDATTIALNMAAPSEVHELGQDGVLHVLAWPDQVSAVELVVKASSQSCAEHFAEPSDLMTSGPGGDLQTAEMPPTLGWCGMSAEAAWVGVNAPFGHALRPLVPQQILWAEIATPTLDLLAE